MTWSLQARLPTDLMKAANAIKGCSERSPLSLIYPRDYLGESGHWGCRNVSIA